MLCPKWISHYLSRRYLRHFLRKKYRLSHSKTCKLRKHLVLSKRVFIIHMTLAPVFICLLLCGDIHPHPGPVLPPSSRHPGARLLNVASWNVRTLLETKRTAARPTAIVSRELARYNIDIAALSETRVLGDSELTEAGGGYTFYLKGKDSGQKRHHGVGFAIRSKLVAHLQGSLPKGINERLMTMSLPLEDTTLSIISAYAPTLASSDELKETFYNKLTDAINNIPFSHKLLVMGDFNARVGTDNTSWENVIGKHGVGNENSNGTLLLSMCSQLELVITNTIFQQANNHKTTWMHPGSKKWHMIDYVITRQRDIKDVNRTRAMCGTCVWSDHRLVKSKLALRAKSSRLRHRIKPCRKLDVSKLKSSEVRSKLAIKLQEAYAVTDSTGTSAAATWDTHKCITLKVAEEVLGFPERKHRDWFDENDPLIKPLLNQLHALHIDVVADKRNSIHNTAKENAYNSCKKQAQKSLRTMQNTWWEARATELQVAADHRDFRSFYQGLKAVYGPTYKANAAIKSKDGAMLTEPAQVLDRWAEHFNGVLNQDSEFDMSVLDEIPQWDVNMSLAALPTIDEVLASIKQLTGGKSPGNDGIPPDVYKHGGTAVAEELLELFIKTWHEGQVVQDFRDASIVHLYKNKGDRACCDNHRGISLLCIAGKVLARLMLNRLIKHTENIGLIPESQCGFRPERSTDDMVFAVRQLQEKCKQQNQDLYLLFIDLTKAFDTVNREGLWRILEKAGCPPLFVRIISSFHDNMKATVREGSGKSEPFNVTSGTKQGCVLAPTLFSIFFSLMLHVAFKDTTDGVDIESRFDRGLCSTKNVHFKAKTKVTLSTIRDLLFADDCALAACSLKSLQHLCDRFATAARRFGLTISIKKTEVLYQPASGNAYVPPSVKIEGKQLNAVDNFKYLGSTISNCASIDSEITARIAKATAAFGRLTKRLWANRNIRLDTKIAVYKAAVITSLLFGCGTWSLKKQHIFRLEKFHQASLRKISRIRWFHKVTNYEVLSRCNINSLESMVDSARLRWTGHVVRMKDNRIPKALLYGRLASGVSRPGNHKTYLNSVNSTLRACGINGTHLEELASVRGSWRATTRAGIATAEADRIKCLIDKRDRRKARADLVPLPTFHQHPTPPPPLTPTLTPLAAQDA
jgi:exonuclease III